MKPFVHLHGHSEYSLIDGISRLTDMVERAKALEMPALALTDHGNMHGAVNFYKLATQVGIKPILGCEVYVTTEGSRFDRPEGKQRERLKHLVLLAETYEGYKNIVKIVSKSCTEGFYFKPRTDRELLSTYKEGIIALSACIAGEIPQYILEDNEEGARRALEWYIDNYGKDNFFLEIQNHGDPRELRVQDVMIELSREYGVGLVCSNDFHYVEQGDSEAHDIKFCISTGAKRSDEKRLRFYNNEFYMKSGDEMADLFPHVPEALENTLRIAERCCVELPFGEYHLPKFDVPEGETAESYLRTLCEGQIPQYYDTYNEELKERLDYELGVINRMGFEDYFLIVWDYVRYARENEILVGPGRGSAAGSVVAYLLGITGLDPLKYDLLFERFLNPERISMPDIDIDFCYERRGETIDYVTEKYGQERVAQIITYGTEAARAVIRDVGRVLDMPLAEVNRIAKMIPNELGITLTKALGVKDLKELYDNNPSVKELFDFGLKLEGIARNTSTHAAGVVISGGPLDEHVPVQLSNEGYVTQYDKDNIEELGLLKMDFLGLRTLTVMGEALRLIEENHGVRLDLDAIPLDDADTCAVLSRGETAGVFQLESEGITKLVMDLKPEHFEDLIPLVALYRPGPLGSGMVSDFIERRHGKQDITYLHPMLEPILKDTFGVILYQEQVMKIASAMGGFSLGQADLMRRAMGKKKESVLKAQRDTFLEGALQNGIDEAIANEVFDLLLYFAGYGFNKSHSAAYAYIAYQTAYLKAHYFPEFMAATMTSFMTNMDKLTYYINECYKYKVKVLGPDINWSDRSFTVQDGHIRFGLGGIKNVGDNAITQIIEGRKRDGQYSSLLDLCERVDHKVLNRRSIESLIRCGAMDSFSENRNQLLAIHEQALSIGAKRQKDRAVGAMSLFGDDTEVTGLTIPVLPDLSEERKLKDEKEYTGFYITGHPLTPYAEELEPLFDIGKLKENPEAYDGRTIVLGGLIVQKVDRITRQRQETMSIVKVEDFTGAIDVVAFPKAFSQYRRHLEVDRIIRVQGRVDADEKGVQIIAETIGPLKVDYSAVKSMVVHIRRGYNRPDVSRQLKQLLFDAPGTTRVRLYVHDEKKSITVDERFFFTPTTSVIQALEELLGDGAVELL